MLFFLSKNNRADVNSEETQVSIDNVQHFDFSLINLLNEFIKKTRNGPRRSTSQSCISRPNTIMCFSQAPLTDGVSGI